MITTCKKTICMALIISLLAGMIPVDAFAQYTGGQAFVAQQLEEARIAREEAAIDQKLPELMKKEYGDIYSEVKDVLEILQGKKKIDTSNQYNDFKEAYLQQINKSYKEGLASLDKEAPKSYTHFTAAYQKTLKKTYQQMQKECKSEKEKANLESEYKRLSSSQELQNAYEKQKSTYEAAYQASLQTARAQLDKQYKAAQAEAVIRKAWKQYEKSYSKDDLKETAIYLRGLSKRIGEIMAQQKSLGGRTLEDRAVARETVNVLFQILPALELMGFLDPKTKELGVRFAISLLRDKGDVCTSDLDNNNAKRCQNTILPVVNGLAVLLKPGKNSGKHFSQFNAKATKLIEDILKKGRKTSSSAAVIQQCGLALVELGHTGTLFGLLHEMHNERPGFWAKVGETISIQENIKYAKEIRYQGRWINKNSEGSYYKGAKGIKQNAWTDLGEYLGQLAVQNKTYKKTIDAGVKAMIDANANGTLDIKFPAFIAGLLLSGYKLPATDSFVVSADTQVMNNRGEISRTKGNKARWDKVNILLTHDWQTKKLLPETQRLDLSGYALYELYLAPKAELEDGVSAAYLNNRLLAQYQKGTVSIPSAADPKARQQHHRRAIPGFTGKYASKNFWNEAEGVGFAADIVLMIWGGVTIFKGAIQVITKGWKLWTEAGAALRATPRGRFPGQS